MEKSESVPIPNEIQTGYLKGRENELDMTYRGGDMGGKEGRQV